MKWTELLSTLTQIRGAAQGAEADLLQRKRRGLVALIAASSVALVNVLVALEKENHLQDIKTFVEQLAAGIWNCQWQDLGMIIQANFLIGLSILLFGGGLISYLTLRHTGLLLRESREPFRYSYEIASFKPVEGFPEPTLLNLLHHDLGTRLKERIPRLSPREIAPPGQTAPAAQTSHISISGSFALRQGKNGQPVLQVIPRIRVGPPGSPETLADPVHFEPEALPAPAVGKGGTPQLLPGDYSQLVERVYFSIATEIYQRIRTDVREKVELFPTAYFQAVARFHEAKDFERSNTLDAYRFAIELYREAKDHFDDTSLWSRLRRFVSSQGSRIRRWLSLLGSALLPSVPFGAQGKTPYLQMEAQVRIGYTRAIIYERILSALSARAAQSHLFEIPEQIEISVRNLFRLFNSAAAGRKLKLPDRAEWALDADVHKSNCRRAARAFLAYSKRSSQGRARLFEEPRKALFDACTVAALAFAHLNAPRSAANYLELARALAPDRYARDPLWLLAAGGSEADFDKKLLYFRQATELAPRFEIAHYLLAQGSERRLRRRDEVSRDHKDRAALVMAEFEKVLEINPGNIGALAAQGYLCWLVGELDEAASKFKEGSEVKARIRETFIGELYYGLARIAAERGQWSESYNLYSQAVAADPAVAAYNIIDNALLVTVYYEFISPGMLRRYQEFRVNVALQMRARRREPRVAGVDGEASAAPPAEPAPAGSGSGAGSPCGTFGSDVRVESLTYEIMPGQLPGEADLAPAPVNGPSGGPNPQGPPGLPAAGRPTPDGVSASTQNAVYSWVLNDYGNALLNCFQRRNSKTHLEHAVRCFETATKKNPQNAVAYYNLHEPYYQRGDDAKVQPCLDTAQRLAPAWPVAIIAAARARIRQRQERIHKNQREQIVNEGQLARTKQELAEINDWLKGADSSPPQREDSAPQGASVEPVKQGKQPPEEIGSAGGSQLAVKTGYRDQGNQQPQPPHAEFARAAVAGVADGPTTFREFDRRQKERDRDSLEGRLEELGERQITLQETADRLQAELAETVKAGVPKIAQTSILSSLFRETGPEQLPQAILALEIDWGRLDENDVAIFTALAEIFLGQGDAASLKAAESLSAKIAADCYPEGFDVNWILQRLLDKRTADVAPGQGGQSPAGPLTFGRDKLAYLVQNRLEEDPDASLPLQWLRVLFPDLEERCGIFKTLIKNSPSSDTYHALLGDEYGNAADHDSAALEKALEAYANARRLNPFTADHPARLAKIHQRRRKWGSAIEAYAHALDLDRDNTTYKGAIAACYYGLALEEEQREGAEGGWEALKNAAEALRAAQRFAPDDPRYAAACRRTEEREGLARAYGTTSLDRWPVVHPIVVQVADDLVPLLVRKDSDSLSDEVVKLISDLRRQVRDRFGVQVPGIRFRAETSGLADGAYIIVIAGVPVVSGLTPPDKLLCLADAGQLAAHGIAAEEIVNPVSGDPASWVLLADQDKLQGLPFWDRIKLPLQHAQAVIEANLAEFVGHQEALYLLDEEPKLAERLRAEPDALAAWVQVLRALLREKVPVTAVAVIAGHFAELWRAGADLSAVVEAIRSLPEVRPQLPGNNQDHDFCPLSRRFEATIRQGLSGQGRQRVLALERLPCQTALGAIRKGIGSRRQVALLVHDEQIRPFIRKLCELALPRVPVLAERELQPDLRHRSRGVIDLP